MAKFGDTRPLPQLQSLQAAVLLVLGSSCTTHVPTIIMPSSAPMPDTWREDERVTVTTCGSETMDDLYQRAKEGHDALVEITLTRTDHIVPFLSFLNSTCWELSGTLVDFGSWSPAVAATPAVRADAGARDSTTDGPPGEGRAPPRGRDYGPAPASAYRLLELVYQEIGRSVPKDTADLTADAELIWAYAQKGRSPSDLLTAASAGAATVSKTALLQEILDAGIAATLDTPTKDAFNEDE